MCCVCVWGCACVLRSPPQHRYHICLPPRGIPDRSLHMSSQTHGQTQGRERGGEGGVPGLSTRSCLLIRSRLLGCRTSSPTVRYTRFSFCRAACFQDLGLPSSSMGHCTRQSYRVIRLPVSGSGSTFAESSPSSWSLPSLSLWPPQNCRVRHEQYTHYTDIGQRESHL